MGKKKIKTSSSLPTSNLKGAKTLSRLIGKSALGIQANSTGGKTEEVVTTYGVVASEYNIQAQIEWLTAPPTTNDKKSSTTTAPQAPPKKPQRGFHKDVCEGCGEGECLMYCDKCPAAFHAICDDPPLPPEDYEIIGLTWRCKKCRIAMVKEESGQDLNNDEGSDPAPSCDGPLTKLFQQSLPYFSNQNPSEFKLGTEMPAYDYPFPGTSRHLLKGCRQRTSVVEVENGIVPRPTALCYHCQKSCRIGALIQCDKCDEFFHLDCLDPPLTTIPTSIWICPLHVEPYLESTQLDSVALSERVKIWENGNKPINRSSIILDFLRKSSRKNPMFRRKRAITMAPAYDKIPEMVINCYKEDKLKCLKQRLPSLNTLAAVCELERVKLTVGSPLLTLATNNMETDIEKYKRSWRDLYLPVGLKLVEAKEKVDMLKTKNCSKMDLLKQMLEVCNSDVNENPIEGSTYCPETEIGYFEGCRENNGGNENKLFPPSWLQEQIATAATDVAEDEKQTNEIMAVLSDVSTTLDGTSKNFPKFLNLPKNGPLIVDGMTSATDIIKPFKNPTKGKRTTRKYEPLLADAAVVKTLSTNVVKKLATSHLKCIRHKRRIREQTRLKKKDGSICLPTFSKHLLRLYIENNGTTVELTKNNIWIGSDDSCDWKITDIVSCNRVDKKHAMLFYNPTETCWEMLNYSPNGLYVNHTLFGFKCSTGSELYSDKYQEMHERSNQRIEEFIANTTEDLQKEKSKLCFCKPYPYVRAASDVFEGSAKIHAGHRIQIGCIKITVQGVFFSPTDDS